MGHVHSPTTILVLFCTLLAPSLAYKFLMMPLTGRSHILMLTSIAEELVHRGHQVHILIAQNNKLISSLIPKDSNITIEPYGSTKHSEFSLMDHDEMQEMMTRKMLEEKKTVFEMKDFMTALINGEIHHLLVDNEELIQRLDKIKFDMAVVDSLFFMKFLYLIPLRLGVPWITFSDFIPAWTLKLPFLPSFVPLKITEFTDKMSFVERIKNTFVNLAFYSNEMVKVPESAISKYRQYGEFHSFDDLVARSELVITTNHVVLDYSVPLTPNIISVGGLTTGKRTSNGARLPEDMERFVAGGKEGVIVVSFGSMASSFPKEIALKFNEAFSKLPDHRFIWRMNNKDNLQIPENVMIAKWLPQDDLLANARVKLFITHCGANGQFEAVYHAVPMIGFPIFGDQPYNAKRLEYKGYGIAMNIQEFTVDELLGNIRKVLSDGAYKERISLASAIFRSERESPAEKAVYWIEHVTKFGGEHLKSGGSQLALYQYLMLDILAVIIFGGILLLTVIYKVGKLIIRKCTRVSVDTKSNSKKRN